MWWGMPLLAGYVLAVPFAVITASPALGRWFQRTGLCAIPEDVSAPPEVEAVLKASRA